MSVRQRIGENYLELKPTTMNDGKTKNVNRIHFMYQNSKFSGRDLVRLNMAEQ